MSVDTNKQKQSIRWNIFDDCNFKDGADDDDDVVGEVHEYEYSNIVSGCAE